ncbi:MAG: hypothetical protein JWL63_1949 [Rhodocyclales bacterium]|nr:hypothetical protein [Rhodocyclales bacterium]
MGMQIREQGRDSFMTGHAADVFAGNEFYDGQVSEAFEKAALLEQALRRLEQQDRVLAFFEQKWLAAQHDVQILMDSQQRTKDRLARLTERARHLYRTAIHDELTGLANRRLLVDRLAHAIVQADRNNKKIGVVFLDLHDFEHIHEQHGRDISDQALQQLARRLESCVRGGDTVGRYGADEFVILLPEVQRPRNIETVLDKLRTRLSKPFLVEDRVIRLTADFGVAVYPNDARHPHDLIQRADAAVYKIKHRHDA